MAHNGIQILMTPKFISKHEMIKKFGYPYYGYTKTFVGVWIRDDLPGNVTQSVMAHEMQHWNDRAFIDGRVLYWEFRAWKAGFIASKSGFFRAIWMSITDIDRLKLYVSRVVRGF